jgi:hypothetical protein
MADNSSIRTLPSIESWIGRTLATIVRVFRALRGGRNTGAFPRHHFSLVQQFPETVARYRR